MLIMLVVVGALAEPQLTHAQVRAADTLNLVDRYRTARVQMLARRALKRGWTAQTLPALSLPVTLPPPLRRALGPSDSSSATDASDLSFTVDDVRRVRRLERGWFQERFGDVGWSFLGASPELTFFDTTYTRELRARLQAQFGAPTRTVADRPDSSRVGAAQFEYWFVVNDSVPVRVTDANGPRDRGLIVAAPRRLRDRLPDLRAALLRPLREPERAPYVDYYVERTETGARRWYRTGFDGQSYFLQRVFRFDIQRGQRARLPADSTATSPPDSTPPDSARPEPSSP